MAGRDVAGIAVLRVFDDGPGIAFRMAGMGMMGAGEIGKGRVIGAVRRGVQGAVRAGHVGVMMDAGLPLVAEGVVVVLAFLMREVVLRGLAGGTDAAELIFLFRM